MKWFDSSQKIHFRWKLMKRHIVAIFAQHFSNDTQFYTYKTECGIELAETDNTQVCISSLIHSARIVCAD